MKNLLTLLFLIFAASVKAQNPDLEGIYFLEVQEELGVTQHKMTLDGEGTFLFSMYFAPDESKGSLMKIISMYGSGKWRNDGSEILFVVDRKEDFDKDRILDFSNTRARLEKPSLSNLKEAKSPIDLVFFYSDIPWVKGLRLPKQ